MGPIGVKAHLAPYLAGPRVVTASTRGRCARDHRSGLGRALGLALDPADLLDLYRDDGRRGADAATKVAILNANYIAKRLAPHFPILYAGKNGLVAHECIIDLRRSGRRAASPSRMSPSA